MENKTYIPPHLTTIPDAELLAWHNFIDIAAWRTDNGDELYLEGKKVKLTSDHLHPTQQIINLCHMKNGSIEQKQRIGILLRNT